MHRTLTAVALVATFATGCDSSPGTSPTGSDAGTLDGGRSDVPAGGNDVPGDGSVAADGADGAGTGIRDVHAPPVDPGRVIETGVRREVFQVMAPAAAPNPTTMVATPLGLNAVQVLRYRVDAATPVPVQSVVVAMPGFLGGAASFDPLARALVRRSAAAGTPVEVWAIDRRSNLLEDLRGMNVADAQHDPELASGYYLDGTVTVDGHAFDGYVSPTDPAQGYMAEWGVPTTLADLHAVIARVPDPRHHVILMGHSLGGTLVEAYAAWDFDGTAGYRTLAGLVLVDGVAPGTAITQTEYTDGGTTMGMPFTGLTALRAHGPFYVSLPVLGVQALVVSEIVARRAALAPTAVVTDTYRDRVLRLLLGVAAVPPLTNAAAMGFAFDDASCPLAFARMSVGAPAGGPVRRQANPFSPGEMLTVPDSATATYTWTDALAATPPEFTPIANASSAWAATPTNFGEWYFPSRLTLDAGALGTMRLGPSDWQTAQGFRASHGGEIDVPVLGISAALTGTVATAFDGLRGRIATAVGADLPHAGATRMAPEGFRAFAVPGMSHLDPLAGADTMANPVPTAVLSFATGNTTGTVTVP